MQPTPQYQVAPSPGTYYYDEQSAVARTGHLAVALTAFMILERVTFGFGVFGFCASLPRIFMNDSVSGFDLGGGYFAYLIFSTLIGLISIASSGFGLFCGAIFPTVKTVLLSLKSTRESAKRELT